MNPPASRVPEKSASRAEMIWLAAAVVFGTIVRLSFLGRIAVEHFDEGVYASNFWFGPEQGYSYPAQHLYAPPLLPAAIEWTMILANLIGIKPTGFIPMIPSLVAGMVMIPSIWWIGRRWFSPTAGMISAWIVATSDFHACYSRAALTDVPVCLFILWAAYFMWNALVKANRNQLIPTTGKKPKSPVAAPLPWRDLILASTFTALAWWTKYNGWLPLAIGVAGAGFWQLISPRESRQIGTTLKCLALIVGLSFFAWSPVLWGLQSKGGYAAVAANHKQYIVGFRGWLNSAVSQLRHVGMYDDWAGILIEPAIMTSNSDVPPITLSPEEGSEKTSISGNQGSTRLSTNCSLANDFVVVAFPTLLLAGALIACIWKIRTSSNPDSRIAACLLLTWLLGMTVSTPFYHPYPRLVFPWLTAVWIAIGLAFDCWRNRPVSNMEYVPHSQPWGPKILEVVLVCWIGVNCIGRLVFGAAHAWSDRTGIASSAQTLATEMAAKLDATHRLEDGAIAYTWGEPAVLFGLKSAGMSYVGPIQDLGVAEQRPQLPTFVVFGNQAFFSSQFADEKRRLDRCDFVKAVQFHQSHLVELDSKNSADFYLSDKSRQAFTSDDPTKGKGVPNLWLYRVKGD